MNKKGSKGFTLVELLVTIALMLSLLGIAIVSFIKTGNNKKEESYKLVEEQILAAGEQYFQDNEYLFAGLSENAEGYITVGKLVSEDYLNKVTDPRTGKALSYCTVVKVVRKDGVLKVDSVIENTDSNKNNEEACKSDNSVRTKDADGPDVTMTIKGTLGNNGWYKEKPVELKTEIKEDGNGNIISVQKCESETCTAINLSESYTDIYKNNNEITVKYIATNIYGKTGEASVNFKVDSTPPNINGHSISGDEKFTSLSNWTNSQTAKVTTNITDNFNLSKVEKYINGKSTDTNFPINNIGKSEVDYAIFLKNYKTDGKRKIRYVAYDEAGNEKVGEFNLNIDRTGPVCNKITVTGANNNKTHNGWYNNSTGAPTATFTATDSYSGIENGKDKATVTAKTKGENTVLTSKFYDKAGNERTCKKTVKYDTGTPAKPSVRLLKWKDNNKKPISDNHEERTEGEYNSPNWTNKKVYTMPTRKIDDDTSESKFDKYYFTTTGKTKEETDKAGNYRNIEANGTSTIVWKACNEAGNCNSSNKITFKIDWEKPITYAINKDRTLDVVGTNCTDNTKAFSYVSGSGNTWEFRKHAEGGLVYSDCVDNISGVKEEYVMWDLDDTDSSLKGTNVNTGGDYVLLDTYKTRANAFKFTGSSNDKTVHYKKYCTDNAGNKSDVLKIELITHAQNHSNCK